MAFYVFLSPSKGQRNLDEVQALAGARELVEPTFADAAAALGAVCKTWTVDNLARRWKMSPAKAEEVYEMWQSWGRGPGQAAVLTYDGPAFRSLDASSLGSKEKAGLLSPLRIFSALYGVLGPWDAIHPYRLDFTLGSVELAQGSTSLKSYWKAPVAQYLGQTLGPDDWIVDLASSEFSFLLEPVRKTHRVISPVFLEAKDGGGWKKAPSAFAKQGRGALAREILLAKPQSPDDLVGISAFRYSHNCQDFDQNQWTFTPS